MVSAFDGVFEDVTLVLPKAGGADSGEVDDWGNPIPTPGGTETVRVWLKPRSAAFSPLNLSADLQSQPGADGISLTFVGRLIEPVAMPSGIPPGTECDLTLNGVAGTFRLEASPKGVLAEVDAVLGQRLFGSWRATQPA